MATQKQQPVPPQQQDPKRAPQEQDPKKAQKAVDASVEEVQAKTDEAEAKGHYGVRVDPTPLEHYTVDGVTSGKPTPETDPKAAAKAAEATGTPPNVVT